MAPSPFDRWASQGQEGSDLPRVIVAGTGPSESQTVALPAALRGPESRDLSVGFVSRWGRRGRDDVCAYYPPSFQDRLLQGQRRGEVSAHRHKQRACCAVGCSELPGDDTALPFPVVGEGICLSWRSSGLWEGQALTASHTDLEPEASACDLAYTLTEAWGWRFGEPGECLGSSRCLMTSCSFSPLTK